jgi:hypothetical protein
MSFYIDRYPMNMEKYLKDRNVIFWKKYLTFVMIYGKIVQLGA